MRANRLLGVLVCLGLAVSGAALAQNRTYTVYADNDGDPATGCSENGFGGADVRLQVVSSGGTAPAVVDATQAACSGGSFGAPVTLSGGAALGFGGGVAGSDVIEMATSTAFLRPQGAPLRLGVMAASAQGSDRLFTLGGNDGDPPIVVGNPASAEPVPLLGVPTALLLIVLLLGIGARRARRWRLFALLLSLLGTAWAAQFVVDGNTTDWVGIAPLANDPAGDATSGETSIDLRALFVAAEGGNTFLRLDLTRLRDTAPTAHATSATTLEDAAVTLTLTGSDPQAAALTFAIATPPAHGTLGAIVPIDAGSASVQYTPDPNANGSDSFTFTAANAASTSAPAAAGIAITPVNDAPQFTTQAVPAVNENAGPQTAVIATAIAAGPATAADEATQALDFIVTANDNAALFAAAPSVSPAGVLSYEPAANASGSATLGIALHDDGGSANGGIDTSAVQQVTITVNPVDNAPVLTAGATLAYVENDPPAVIDAGVTVDDIDSATLAGATVRISAGYQSGADALAFAGTATIAGSFDSATGTLSLSGADTLANYQAALRAVTYANTSDDPATAARTVTWQASDGNGNSAAVTSAIALTAVNDPATLAAGATLAYVEGDAATAIDTTLTIADPDNAQLVGASVHIAAGYANGEDLLAFAPAGGITGSFDAGSGTLTLNGTASLAAYQAALRAVTYANASANPSTAPRTVAWQVNDGTAPSNVASSTVTVGAVDNAPVVTSGANVTFTEGDAPLPADAGLTVTDADSAQLAGARVQISANYQNGADQLGFADTATIAGSWDAPSGTLTLSGADTPAAYQVALRSVSFQNTSQDPSTAPRTLSYVASDGSTTSLPATSTIAVVAVDDAPVLSGGQTVAYTEDDPPLVIDGALAASDPDNTTLAGATVQISVNYVAGEDVLDFTPTGAITGSFLAATGVLTLSGNDTLASYQAALRGVTYRNTSQNPGAGVRTASFQVSDGTLSSNLVDSTIAVVPVNDAPAIAAGAAVSYKEGDPAVVADSALTVTDADNATLAGATVQIGANFDAAQDVLAFTPAGSITGSYDNATGALSLSGSDSVANYEAALRSVTYRNTSQNPSTGTRTLAWSASDGAATSAAAASTVAIVSINSAPSFTAGASPTVDEDIGARSIASWATAIGDGDGGGQTLTFEVTGNSNAALFGAGPAVSSNGTLTFTPAPDANGTATITLVLHDDGGTANGGVDTSPAQTFTITVDAVNDAPGFTRGANVTVLENAGAQTVDPWATALSAGPSNESAQTLAFEVTGNTNAALFAAAPAVSPTGALTFTPATNASGTATITLVLHDSGGTANGGVDTSAAQTFTISVTDVNQAPGFVAGANPTVDEDAGARTIADWATSISQGAGDSGQTLTFEVTNNTNAALFSAGPAVSPTTGALTFTPAADANGTAVITLVLKDDGGTANGGVDTSTAQTFTITVNAVNDAPSFTKGADASVYADQGAQTVNPWATAMSAGPANESGQTVTFQVTGNSNPSLFSAAPAVTPGGALTFTSAANSSGAATITLVAKDDGGTANGGVDTSAAQTFTITILFVNHAPTFTPGGNVVVNEDSGAYAAAWASALDDGDLGVSQNLDFLVANNNNALFSAQPAISPGGVLGFTPAPNAFGSATVSVRLHDDGGTANGGVDTSALQTFTITVNPVNDPPVAVAHTLQTHSGIAITIGNGDSQRLKDGATDVDNATADLSVSNTFTAVTPVGATVTLLDATTGAYRFDPPPGYSGNASFNYSVCDNGVPPPVQCASNTVSVTITGPDLWFVNAAVAGTGSGRLSDPFKSLASVPGGRGTGDRVFVLSGTYASGFTLNVSEDFVGQGASGSFDTLLGVSVPANGTLATRPALGGAAPTIQGTVTMANASKVQGMAISSGASVGLVASGRTGLRASETSVASSTTAVDIANSSAAASGVTLTSSSSSGGTYGLHLVGLSGGDFNFGNGTLTGNTTTAFHLGVSSANVGYNGTLQASGATRPAFITGVSGSAQVTLGGTVTAANGIQVASNTGGTIRFTGTSQTLNTGTNIAVDLNNNAGASVVFSGGGLAITTSSATGFSATGGGSVSVTGSGNTISTTGAGLSLTVVSTRIDAAGVTFRSITSNAAGARAVLLDNTGTAAGDGGLAVTGSGTTTNSGGTIQNKSVHGVLARNGVKNLSLSNMGFTSNGTNQDVAATCGNAFAGTNTNCGAAIQLLTASNVSLANVDVSGGTQIGINGNDVNGLGMNDVTVQNVGDENLEDGVQFVNLRGTVNISNSIFRNNYHRQFEVQNPNASSALAMTMDNDRFDRSSYGTSVSAQGALIAGNGSSVMSTTITNSTFRNNWATALTMQGIGNAAMTFNIGTAAGPNTFSDNSLALQVLTDNASTMNATVSNNTITVSPVVTAGATPVTFRKGTNATGLYVGSFTGNTIGSASVVDSGNNCAGCNGVSMTNEGLSGGMRMTVSNNTIQHIRQRGVEAYGQLNDTFGMVVTNNQFRSPDGDPALRSGHAVFMQSGTDDTDGSQLCADIQGNDIVGTWDSGTGNIRLRLFPLESAPPIANFRLRNIGGTGTAADAIAYLNSANTNAMGSATVNGVTNFTTGTAPCF